MPRHKGRKQRRAIWSDKPGETKKSTAANHGLEVVQVEHMRKKQDNKCAICMEPLTGSMVIDHDHELAKLHGHPEVHGCRFCVRALLCSRCNNMLGAAKDDPNMLLRGVAYIKLARKMHNGEVVASPAIHPVEPVDTP